MTDGWLDTTIGDQVTLQRGFDITKKEQREGIVPVVSSGGVSSYHDSAQVHGPGVVLGRKGALGTVYYLKEDFWPHDTTLWVKDFHGNDSRYVYYFFLSTAKRLLRLDVGSANPTLNRNHVHPIRVCWPRKNEQRRIVNVLGTLDDKIELNRKMNRTLEEIARTLFRAWFVDFEGETDLVESEVGLIPRGWEVKPMDEIAHFLNGVACQRYPADEGEDLRVIKIRELRGGFSESSDKVSRDALPDKYVVHDGDVLFSWSGSLVVKIWAEGEGALNQHIFKVTSERYPRWFFYLRLLEHLERFQAIAAGKATTMGHIRRRHLTEALVPVPPDEKLAEASETFAPLLERVVLNRQQDRTLAEIRDTLLPKLISGEIRVPAAEEMVEQAV